MMTLDEAIQHAEEVAENQEEDAKEWEYTLKVYRDIKHYDSMSIHNCEKAMEGCKTCAEEHRQLAEWLKDYKNMKARERGCDGCKYDEEDNGMCWECDENCSNWESE